MKPEGANSARLRYESRLDSMKVVFEGSDGRFETMRQCWRELAERVRARRPTALLVVDRLAGEQVTPEQQAELITGLVGSGIDEVRMAYVARPQAGFAFVERAEILAREMGFNVRAFDTEHAAEIWLRHGER